MLTVGYLPFCIGSIYASNQLAHLAFLSADVTDQQIADRVDAGDDIFEVIRDLALGVSSTRTCSVPTFGESWADVIMSTSASYPYNMKVGATFTYDYESYVNATGVQSGPGVQTSFVSHVIKRHVSNGHTPSVSNASIAEATVRAALLVDPTTLNFVHYGALSAWSYLPEEVSAKPNLMLGYYSGGDRVNSTAIHLDLGEVKDIDRVALSVFRDAFGSASVAYAKVVAWVNDAWVDLAVLNSASITNGSQKYVFEITPVQARYVSVIGYGHMPNSYPSGRSSLALYMVSVGDSNGVDAPTVIDRAIVVTNRDKSDLINLNISDKPSYAILTVAETGNAGEIVLQSKTLTGAKVPVYESATLPFGVKP